MSKLVRRFCWLLVLTEVASVAWLRRSAQSPSLSTAIVATGLPSLCFATLVFSAWVWAFLVYARSSRGKGYAPTYVRAGVLGMLPIFLVTPYSWLILGLCILGFWSFRPESGHMPPLLSATLLGPGTWPFYLAYALFVAVWLAYWLCPPTIITLGHSAEASRILQVRLTRVFPFRRNISLLAYYGDDASNDAFARGNSLRTIFGIGWHRQVERLCRLCHVVVLDWRVPTENTRFEVELLQRLDEKPIVVVVSPGERQGVGANVVDTIPSRAKIVTYHETPGAVLEVLVNEKIKRELANHRRCSSLSLMASFRLLSLGIELESRVLPDDVSKRQFLVQAVKTIELALESSDPNLAVDSRSLLTIQAIRLRQLGQLACCLGQTISARQDLLQSIQLFRKAGISNDALPIAWAREAMGRLSDGKGNDA